MNLPETFRVKISSDGAELIAMTPVVSQDMRSEELVRWILGVTGKDTQRVAEILHRGSLTAGASRLRWPGVAVAQDAVREFLLRYPDADPGRAFDADQCDEIVLRGGVQQMAVSREAASKRRWFHGQSFWHELVRVVPSPSYLEYSYRHSADVYRAVLSEDQRAALDNARRLLTFPLRVKNIESIDFYVSRPSS